MKLDQLLKREDFKEIFTSTLSKYLMLSENWEGKITWGIHRKNSLKLIVNKNIKTGYQGNREQENQRSLFF